MKVGEILRLLGDDGWMVSRYAGSHRQLIHQAKPGEVTVAGEPSDRPEGYGVEHPAASWSPSGRLPGRGGKLMNGEGYLVVIEEGPESFGAWAPDLPGVGAAAETREECISLMREAIAFHIDGLREDGDTVPEPSHSSVIYVNPAAA